MSRLRGRLSFANVMSVLAVFIALGGTSLAVGRLPKNSVGTKQLKKNAVTTAKIKNRAVTGSKLDLSSIGTVPSATTAANAGDANTLDGRPASAFASSSAIRSVAIDAGGNVVARQSDGVTQANLRHGEGSGTYCIDGLSPAPTTVAATLSFGGEFGAEILAQVSPAPGYLCEGAQIGVLTVGAEGAKELPFSLIIH